MHATRGRWRMRVELPQCKEGHYLRCPASVGVLFHQVLAAEDMHAQMQEHFWVAILDSKNMVRSAELIGLGTLNASIVHPREVFCRAVVEHAQAVILVHNHPSGNPAPSREDIMLTRRLQKAGNILGIEVLDHVIVANGGDQFTSLKDAGHF